MLREAPPSTTIIYTIRDVGLSEATPYLINSDAAAVATLAEGTNTGYVYCNTNTGVIDDKGVCTRRRAYTGYPH